MSYKELLKDIISDDLGLEVIEPNESLLAVRLTTDNYMNQSGDKVLVAVFECGRPNVFSISVRNAFTVPEKHYEAITRYCLGVSQKSDWLVRWGLDRDDGELFATVIFYVGDDGLSPNKVRISLGRLLHSIEQRYEEMSALCDTSNEPADEGAQVIPYLSSDTDPSYPGDHYFVTPYYEDVMLRVKNFPAVSGVDRLFRRFTQEQVHEICHKIRMTETLPVLVFVREILGEYFRYLPAGANPDDEDNYSPIEELKPPFWFLPYCVLGQSEGVMLYFEQNGVFCNQARPFLLSSIFPCEKIQHFDWNDGNYESQAEGRAGSIRISNDDDDVFLTLEEFHGDGYSSQLKILEACWEVWEKVVDASRESSVFLLNEVNFREFYSWEEVLEWSEPTSSSGANVGEESDADSDEGAEDVDVSDTADEEEEETSTRKPRRKPNPAFMKPMQPDELLAAIVGNKPLARTQAVKKLWAYIKKNGLEDAANKRMINADENLKPVFGGKDQVSMFEMTKLMAEHLIAFTDSAESDIEAAEVAHEKEGSSADDDQVDDEVTEQDVEMASGSYQDAASDEQLEEIKELLSSEDEADHQQAGEQLQAAQVTELDLSQCEDLTDAGLSHLSGLTGLTSLDLHWCEGITDAGLSRLSGLTSLTTLNLRGCKSLTDAGLLHLTSLTNLTSLLLGGISGVTNAGLSHLSGLTSLTSLDLGSSSGLSDAGLAHLSGLINLTELDLGGTNGITNAGLVYLSDLANLTTLAMSGWSGLTDTGLSHLSALQSLTELDLSENESLTDTDLSHLSGLTNLIKLDLHLCTEITDAGLSHLSALPKLKVLALNSCEKITDKGLSHLSGLTSLAELDLTGCDGLTDAGLSHLSGLTSMAELSLRFCEGLTDAGLMHLATLTNLTILELDDSENVSDSVREDPLGHLAQLRSATADTGALSDLGTEVAEVVDVTDTTDEVEEESASPDGVLVLPSSTPGAFVSAAELIHASGKGQATTLGDVLGWFGAGERTDEMTAQLQSLLETAKLSTFPDVASAPLDSPMELRLVQGVAAGTYTIEVEAPAAPPAPLVDDSGRETVELSVDVPAAFVGVGQVIHDTGQGHATTVREVLSWFGAKRRGTQVVSQVEKALSEARLTTFPDVESAPMDSPMELRLGPDVGAGSVHLALALAAPAAEEDAEAGGSEEIDRDFWAAKASPESMEAMDYLASVLGEKVGDCQLVYTKYRVHPCTVDRVCRAVYFSPQRKALMIQLRMPEAAEWTTRFEHPDLSGRYIEKQDSYRLNVMPENIRKHSELWRSVLQGIWDGTIEGMEEEKGEDDSLMQRVRGLFGR